MTHRKLLTLLLLTILLMLALAITNPLLAQQNLNQTTQQTTDDGLKLSVSYPDGWEATTNAQGILIASSASALDDLSNKGLVNKPGDVGLVIYLPNFLDNLNLPHTAPADQVMDAYLKAAKIEGTVKPNSDFSVPATTAVVTPPGQNFNALLGALQFPDATIIIGVVPDTGLDDTVIAILNSITLEAPADIPAVTPDPSVSLTTSSYNYLDIKGSVTLSVGLPQGWVTQYSDHAAILYIGNSDAALQKASSPGVTFEPGDVAITIALPHAVIGLGVPPDADPVQAIQSFQMQTKAQGKAVSDDTFSVPAAHARLTGGNLPDGGGDVYVMQSSKGLVFVVAQPSGQIDGTVMAILQSIQLGDLVAPTATSAPETQQTTTQSTGETTRIQVTQPNGVFELDFDLPNGWLEQDSSSRTSVNIGSNADALQKTVAGNEEIPAGETGVVIGFPVLTTQLGLDMHAAPADAINTFISIVKAKGTVAEDSDFSVPAAHALITGSNIPRGSATLYALAFDGGTLLISVQPGDATSDELLGLLKSIRFSESSGETTTTTSPTEAPAPTAVPAAKPIHQWASSATGTSEYGDTDWSFAQMTGKPDTAECGDQGTAWASEDSTGRAVVQVAFDQPVLPSQINIYQTFNPGAIVEVDVGSSANPNKVLPLPNSADPVGNTACPGVFSVDVSGVDTPIDFVVIYLDQSKTGNWDEIDAVELVGTPAS